MQQIDKERKKPVKVYLNVEMMDDLVPWNAPAVIAIKRKGETDYQPEIAGLSLNAALEYATDPDLAFSIKICIFFDWDGREHRIEGRQIWRLATDPQRPAHRHEERPSPVL